MLNRIFTMRLGSSYKQNNTVEWSIANYWDADSRFFINEKDSNEIQDVFKLIIKSSQHTINKGDIVYASKASEIPRFKLKEFIKDKELKKTSRYNQSDYIIVNKGYLMELIKDFKFDTYAFIKEDFVKANINKWVKDTNNYKINIENIYKNSEDKNLIAMIDHYFMKNVHKDFAGYPNAIKIYDDNTYQIKGTFINLYRNERLKNLLTILYELKKEIKSGKVKIIFDEDLFVELNKEGIELDDDYLQTLRDMLFSKDTTNIKLGFEMMSNLVLNQPTILSISFLLNELIHTTNFRPSYYTNSNTNLKSLFKLLRTKGIYWERDWKTFGTGLRNNFKVGREGDIVKKFLLDNINREFKISNTAAESLVDIVFTTETK